jgi:hypothetical protein
MYIRLQVERSAAAEEEEEEYSAKHGYTKYKEP